MSCADAHLVQHGLQMAAGGNGADFLYQATYFEPSQKLTDD